MRRRFTTTLALALLAAVLAPAAARAQESSMRGTWTYQAQGSDNVAAAINTAVARMNFVTRPIARGRLTRTNQPYRRIVIGYTPQQVTMTFDQRAAIVTPANGTPIKWRREDGEMLDVSTEWENGVLEQTFKADDGQRVNRYTLSDDGHTLTMHVTITSPRLPRPLTYKLLFARAS